MAGPGVRGSSRGATLHLSNPLSCAGHRIAAFGNALGQPGTPHFPAVASLHVGKPGRPPFSRQPIRPVRWLCALQITSSVSVTLFPSGNLHNGRAPVWWDFFEVGLAMLGLVEGSEAGFMSVCMRESFSHFAHCGSLRHLERPFPVWSTRAVPCPVWRASAAPTTGTAPFNPAPGFLRPSLPMRKVKQRGGSAPDPMTGTPICSRPGG